MKKKEAEEEKEAEINDIIAPTTAAFHAHVKLCIPQHLVW